MRTCILGGPRVGKTTLSEAMALADLTLRVFHGDAYITDPRVTILPAGEQWGAAPLVMARDLHAQPGPWLAEGTQLARALRKHLDLHGTRPCDRVIVLRTPRVALTPRQAAAHKVVAKELDSLLPRLVALGVEISDDQKERTPS